MSARGERFYRALLYLYPRAFRERYRDELMRCYRRDRARARFVGLGGAFRFWAYALGDVARTAVSERYGAVRSARIGPHLDSLGTELRFAFRSLARAPRVMTMAAGTLALGIAASTAILSVTKNVLIDPLPYRDPDRLTLIWAEMPESGFVRYPLSGPELDDLRSRTTLFEDFAAIWTTVGALVERDEPETVRLGLVTWNFPTLLGVDPILGRTFRPEEEGAGVGKAVLLSESVWQRRFGAERSVLGRRVRIDGGWGFPGGIYTVVGVLPASFRLVMPSEAGVARDLDALIPFAQDLASSPRALSYLRTIGRLRPGATLAEAEREVQTIGEQIEREFPEYHATGRAFQTVSLKGEATGRAQPVIVALLVGTGFLLLVTCANVANLLLVRAARRRREILVRTAMGASARRLGAQLLTESLVLATVGGAMGIVLGSITLRWILGLVPRSFPRLDTIATDPLVLGVAFGASLLSGALFGLAPILATRKPELFRTLRAASVGTRQRALNTIVVAEVALAFMLSAGAMLSFRTLEALERVELGFQPEGVLTMELTLPAQRYGTTTELAHLTRELERRLRETPGVEAAGAINQLPLSEIPNWSSPYKLRGSEQPEGESREADGRVVTPGYFETVGAHLVAGRFFDGRDDEDSRPVAIVDTLFAARAWPGQTAIGREIEIEVRQERGFVPVWAEVVGVVEHMRHHDPRFEVREQFYVPFAQGARNQIGVVVRGAGDPLELVTPVKAELAALDGDLAVANVRLLEDYARDARAVQRFTMVLATGFAAMAVILGCLGLFGVVAYTVSSREREIGLRLALGATSSGVARWVLRHGVGLALLGIAVGLAGALASGRILEGLLFGVTPNDAATLALVPALLAGVALAASWVPARRATRVDPASVLKLE